MRRLRNADLDPDFFFFIGSYLEQLRPPKPLAAEVEVIVTFASQGQARPARRAETKRVAKNTTGRWGNGYFPRANLNFVITEERSVTRQQTSDVRHLTSESRLFLLLDPARRFRSKPGDISKLQLFLNSRLVGIDRRRSQMQLFPDFAGR